MIPKVIEVPKFVEIQKLLTDIHIKDWLHDDLFHFRWWLLICLLITIFIVWCIMLDKSKIHEISLFVFLATIASMVINAYGVELTLWNYPVNIIPIFPPLSSINLTMLPFILSILYQHFKKTKSFIIATIISSVIMCFIIEPILSLIGFYELINWQYLYSLPIYVAMAICIKFVVIKIIVITNNYKIKV